MTDEYGLMPWHFGGPQDLTRREAMAYFRHYEKKKRAEARAAGGNRNKRR